MFGFSTAKSEVLGCMLTRCAIRSHAFPCALTASPHFQAGGSRKLLAQDPGAEKALSYGDVFLQSYEKCACSCLLTPFPQQSHITRPDMHPHISRLQVISQGRLDILAVADPRQIPAEPRRDDSEIKGLRAVPAGMQGIADMAVRREATPQDASSFLARVFEKAGHHLDIFQSLSDFVEGVATHQGVP